MFPALRKIDESHLKDLFIRVNSSLDIILPAILLGYIPMKMLLSMWLPQYAASMPYLIFMLPICVFDGKMQLLFDTYYKVLRRERKLMLLNVSTMFISIVLTVVLMTFFNNINGVLFGILLTLISRSLRAYRYLSKLFDTTMFDFCQNILLVLLFVIVSFYLKDISAFVSYFIIYGIYLALNKNKVKVVIASVHKFSKQ